MRSSNADVYTGNDSRPVALDPRARRAFRLEDLALAQPGTVIVGLHGEQLRVREDGGIDLWPPFGHRSIASDPTAARPLPQTSDLQRARPAHAEVPHGR